MALYERFYNHLTKCLQDRDAFNHFKSADDLDYMTEHRGLDQFKDGFLQQILTHCRMLNLNVDTVLTRCQINDRDGAPFLSTIQYHDRTYHISPNTLRYIDKGLHMLLLFNHFRNQSIKILELGAGYGGQRLILGVLCDLLQIKIDLYTIIDYPQVCQFCQYYLKQVDIDVDILCYDNGHMKDLSTHYNLFFSNYALGELPQDVQSYYIHRIFNNVDHFYLLYNNFLEHGRVNDDLLKYHPLILQEIPLTGSDNKLIISDASL